MGTSISQYAPVFLPGEPRLPDREAWQATVHRFKKSRTLRKGACAHWHKAVFLWQLCPRERWVWRWSSCLSCGGSKCAGTRTASAAGVTVLSGFLQASCSWRSEGLFGQSFSVALPFQALRGFPCLRSFSLVQCLRHIDGPPTGVLFCGSAHQALKGAGWVGPYTVVHVSGVWWASVSVVQLPVLAYAEREVMVMAPATPRDSAVSPCFQGCLAFLHSISHHSLLPSSLHSQQQPLPWDCSAIPKLQLQATVPSRVCMAAARTVWFSFHLDCHRSAVSLSALNVSPLTQTIAQMWGLDPCFCSPTRQRQVQSS